MYKRQCEYCHSKGHGECIQKDDMQEVYNLLKEAEMLVIASVSYTHLGWTNPNPMVGAVIVKDGKIIGEGYHLSLIHI